MSTQHARTALATGTCLTFGLAMAVAVGALPQVVGSDAAPRAASMSVAQPTVAHLLAGHTGHHKAGHLKAAQHARSVTPTAHVAHAASAPTTTVPTAETPKSDLVSSLTIQAEPPTADASDKANIKHAPAHHKKKHHKKHHKKKHHKPAAPAKAPRTTPSSAALSKAISGLKGFVHTPFSPTSAQVADFGNQVCTAFDQNQTFAQVKAVILQKVKQLPFTTVTAGAADYVVKTAVSLYCPGYKSKVS